jgi:hypothetical protein
MADNKTTIVISAVDQTKAALDSATRGVQTLSSTISNIPSFGGLAASLAAFVSAGAFKTLIEETISWAAALDDLSEITGASVENLSALQKVAAISGFAFEGVEQGLVKLAKAIAGADEESKGAGHALAAIGLEAEKLRGLDTAQAMKEVADALSQYADGSGKTALAQDLLGKSGAKLLPFLKDLAEQQELQATLTTEQAAAAEKFEKEVNKLTNASNLYAKSIVIEVVPVLNKWLEQLAEGIRLTGGFGSALLEFGVKMSFAFGGIEATRKELAQLNAELAAGRASNALDMGSTDLSGTLSKIGVMERRLEYQKFQQRQDALSQFSGKSFEDPRDVLSRRLPELAYKSSGPKEPKAGRAGRAAASAKTPGSVQDYDAILMERVASAIEKTDAIKAAELASTLEKIEILSAAGMDPALIKAVRDDLTGATKEAADETKRLNEMLAATPTAQMEKARDDMVFLTKAMEDARITEESYLEAVTARLSLQEEHIKKTLDDMDTFAKQAAKNIQDAFADFLFDPFSKGTKSMLESFGTAIRKMIANAVAADLGKRIFGDVGSGGGFGGIISKGLGGIGDMLPSFDVGTSYVPRDMVAKIHQGERIIPAAQNTGAGGHSVSVVINMGAGGSASDVRRAGGAVAREVLSAISSSRRFA